MRRLVPPSSGGPCSAGRNVLPPSGVADQGRNHGPAATQGNAMGNESRWRSGCRKGDGIACASRKFDLEALGYSTSRRFDSAHPAWGASVERCRSESTSVLETLGSLTQNAGIGRGPPRRNGSYMNPHYCDSPPHPCAVRRRDVRSDDAAANLRHCYHSPRLRRLHRTALRRVLLQRHP
jgi:hypothetical protein